MSTQHRCTYDCLCAYRRDLWSWHLPWILRPVRELVTDPSLQFWTLLSNLTIKTQWQDTVCSKITRIGWYPFLGPLWWCSSTNATRSVETMAKDELWHTSAARPIHFSPPSDLRSAISGALAFGLSVTADIVGAILHPKKSKDWWATLSTFRSYLQASGVGAELEESIMKPLWRGRLLDNIKMLNDVQEIKEPEMGQIVSDLPKVPPETLKEASRYMRFATAAYGVEMIHSAMDRAANHSQLDSDRKAIAFHCLIDDQDVEYIFIDAGGSLTVLRHFIAVDHASKSIVLAIRGTLSISGALVDMQAMNVEFCEGLAHQGIAEQAHKLWEETGDRLLEIAAKHQGYRVVVTGHSLGAGAASLLHVKMHQEGLCDSTCFAFAPPPTYCSNSKDPKIAKAIQQCVGVVHDHDCVPLLGVASIRRLATQLDTVDNESEKMWFWKRFLIFWEFRPVPAHIIAKVQACLEGNRDRVVGEAALEIPGKVVLWIKKSAKSDGFDEFACSKEAWRRVNVFMCSDMITDHMPEAYEDALDSLTKTDQEVAQ